MWPWDWIPMFCVNISFEGLLYKSWCEIQSSVHPSLAMSIVLKKALFSVVLSFLMPFALDRSGVYCYWGAHQLWLHHTQRVFASWPAIAIAPWMHNGWWRLCGLTLQHEGGIVRYPNHGIIWFCGAPLFFFLLLPPKRLVSCENGAEMWGSSTFGFLTRGTSSKGIWNVPNRPRRCLGIRIQLGSPEKMSRCPPLPKLVL